MASSNEDDRGPEDEILNCHYRIMIIGVTGAGKSTACNFFLIGKHLKLKEVQCQLQLKVKLTVAMY